VNFLKVHGLQVFPALRLVLELGATRFEVAAARFGVLLLLLVLLGGRRLFSLQLADSRLEAHLVVAPLQRLALKRVVAVEAEARPHVSLQVGDALAAEGTRVLGVRGEKVLLELQLVVELLEAVGARERLGQVHFVRVRANHVLTGRRERTELALERNPQAAGLIEARYGDNPLEETPKVTLDNFRPIFQGTITLLLKIVESKSKRH